jgi:hypothetical protein
MLSKHTLTALLQLHYHRTGRFICAEFSVEDRIMEHLLCKKCVHARDKFCVFLMWNFLIFVYELLPYTIVNWMWGTFISGLLGDCTTLHAVRTQLHQPSRDDIIVTRLELTVSTHLLIHIMHCNTPLFLRIKERLTRLDASSAALGSTIITLFEV